MYPLVITAQTTHFAENIHKEVFEFRGYVKKPLFRHVFIKLPNPQL